MNLYLDGIAHEKILYSEKKKRRYMVVAHTPHDTHPPTHTYIHTTHTHHMFVEKLASKIFNPYLMRALLHVGLSQQTHNQIQSRYSEPQTFVDPRETNNYKMKQLFPNFISIFYITK